MTNQINGYSYDRNQVKAGILHFGVGNFHRAHLEYMTNKLLKTPRSSPKASGIFMMGVFGGAVFRWYGLIGVSQCGKCEVK